ncbi:MAG: hypothetical protein ACTSYO_03640 [Candidatus Ranarchaeia archaeon]
MNAHKIGIAKATSHDMPMALIFGLLVLVLFLGLAFFFSEILLVLYGITAAFLITSFFNKIKQGNEEVHLKFSIPAYMPHIATILGSITIFFVPSSTIAPYDIFQINLLNYGRLAFSLLLTTFLPGYFLVDLLDNKSQMGTLEHALLSYMIGSFLVGCNGFILLVFGLPISLHAFLSTLILLSALALIHFCVKKRSSFDFDIKTSESNLLVIIGVAMLVVSTAFVLMNRYFPLTGEDVARHYGLAIALSSGFPVDPATLGAMQGYPYFFHIYLAMYFALTGLPTNVSYQLLYFLFLIPVFSFYAFVKGWFKEYTVHSIPTHSFFLLCLMGFGSIVTIIIKIFSPFSVIRDVLWVSSGKTFDIWLRVSLIPDIPSPASLMTTPAFFIFLLFLRKTVSPRLKMPILGLSFLIMYLTHIVESFTILPIVALLALMYRNNTWYEYLVLPVSLIVVLLLEFLSPYATYLGSSSMFSRLSLIYTLGFGFSFFPALVALIVENPVFKRFMILFSKVYVSIVRHWHQIRWLFPLTYLGLVIIWLLHTPLYFGSFSDRYVPLFVYPMRFGVAGLLSTAALFYYLPLILKDKELSFFLYMAGIGYILTETDNFFGFYLPHRHAKFILIGFIVISAWFIHNRYASYNNVSDDIRKKRFLWSLFVITVLGLLSTSFYFILWYYLL